MKADVTLTYKTLGSNKRAAKELKEFFEAIPENAVVTFDVVDGMDGDRGGYDPAYLRTIAATWEEDLSNIQS